MGKKAKKNGDSPDFGDAFRELEEIVEWFERGEIDLDEGLEKFERGLALAKKCKERLKEVENKVSAIRLKFDELDEESEGAS